MSIQKIASARKATRLGLLILSLVSGCGQQDASLEPVRSLSKFTAVNFQSGADTEKIIGKNDLIPVAKNGANIPQKYAPLIDAFGKMSMGCTATHIGNGLVISAGHCFGAPRQRTSKDCDAVTIEWGVRQDSPAYLTSKCKSVLAAQANYEEDYAIFQVEPVPPVKVEFNFDARPAIGTVLTQFSHPGARPLEWSQNCSLQTAAQGGWGSNQFSHQCDSEPGSSGSVLIDDASLAIVGIHNGGMDQWNYATYLTDTPLREFIGRGGSTPVPLPEPAKPVEFPDQHFGPFPNSSSILLSEFGAVLGKKMSFDLLMDLEEGKDFIRIEYGFDQAMELTGFQQRSFRNLALPLKISFRSSKYIRSTTAIFKNIKIMP